mgnify:FL=1
MTREQYNFAATEAAKYHDVDSYLSDVATSTIWGKGFGGEDVPIPAERIRELSDIYAAVNRGMKEIVSFTGLSQAGFAERFLIPLRTVESWCMGTRPCPLCWKMLLQQAVGLLKLQISG